MGAYEICSSRSVRSIDGGWTLPDGSARPITVMTAWVSGADPEPGKVSHGSIH
jgi:hypothetical protein